MNMKSARSPGVPTDDPEEVKFLLREALPRRQENIPQLREALREQCMGAFRMACDLIRDPEQGALRARYIGVKHDEDHLYSMVTAVGRKVNEWLEAEATCPYPPGDRATDWIHQDLVEQLRTLFNYTLKAPMPGWYPPMPTNLHSTVTLMMKYHYFSFSAGLLIGDDNFAVVHDLLVAKYATMNPDRSPMAFATRDFLLGNHGHEPQVLALINRAVANNPWLIETDLLIYLFSCMHDGWPVDRDWERQRWQPLFYRGFRGDPAIFLHHAPRAVTADGLDNMCTLLGRPKPADRDGLERLRAEVVARLGEDEDPPIKDAAEVLQVDRWGELDPAYGGVLVFDPGKDGKAAVKEAGVPLQFEKMIVRDDKSSRGSRTGT